MLYIFWALDDKILIESMILELSTQPSTTVGDRSGIITLRVGQWTHYYLLLLALRFGSLYAVTFRESQEKNPRRNHDDVGVEKANGTLAEGVTPA